MALLKRRPKLEQSTPILVRLYADETITIPTTSGKRTFATSRELFPGFLDRDFERWGTNVPGESTEAIEAAVFEIHRDANYRKMLGSLGGNLGDLFWKVQDQPLTFIEERLDKLHPEGWATFFPFEVKGNHFIAYALDDGYGLGVTVSRFDNRFVWDADDLGAGVNRFDRGEAWYADRRRRVVVPQLN